MHILDTDPLPHATVPLAPPIDFNLALQSYANSATLADVSFVVEGSVVYGHKLVLSMASPAFRAMFSTGFREATNDAIVIPHVSRTVFQVMMKYVYSGHLESGELGWDDLLDLLVAADQYMLDHLKQLCERDLERLLDTTNIDDVMDGATRANASHLAAVCRHFVRNADQGRRKPSRAATASP
ncbi:hypothetical protein DYB32_006797 [Aphanomyces invadans]|uniref:BTB domain-containing protein n=1 Tax=Aphanomyces invadans TaxID=157072 RepID=A0A3R7CXI9_9STRA|nr:hypothetical protein DYB32_006797 [Aphanomyces invadans]